MIQYNTWDEKCGESTATIDEWTTPSDTTANSNHAMLLLIGHWYEFRDVTCFVESKREPAPRPKSWRWYDIFRIRLNPIIRQYKIIISELARQLQERRNLLQHRRWKHRRWLHRLLST